MIKFELDDNQEKKLNAWLKKRKETYTGTIGVGYTISFTQSSIGEFVSVKHPDGTELDLTLDL